MKINNYPKISKHYCSKCGAEFTLNKFDLKKHKLYCDKLSNTLSVNCPICNNRMRLSSHESNLRSLIYGKLSHIIDETSIEFNQNKHKYSKETAIMLNNLCENILDAVENIDVELGEEYDDEIVVEEDMFDD